MATHTENIEYEQQEWDMEFKDPFSVEEDEVTVYCSSGINQPAGTRAGYFSEGRLAVKTVNNDLVQKVGSVVVSSLQTVTHDCKTRTAGVELPNWKKISQHGHPETEASTHSSTTMSVNGSNRMQEVNEPVTSFGKKLSRDTNVDLSSSDVTSEEQLPIPVVLSSAKRFCASEDIENSQEAKHCSAYFSLSPPSAILSNSPVPFAPPAYLPVAYNIPTWPAVSLPLPVNNSRIGQQVRPVGPAPYSAILPHSSNILPFYNQSPTAVVEGMGAAHWPGQRLPLQNNPTKPPPPLPGVDHAAAFGLSTNDLAGLETVPVPRLHNGLTSDRLPFPVPRLIPPFPSPSINRLPFSTSPCTVRLPQQSRPQNTMKSGLPVNSGVTVSTGEVLLSHCSSVGTQQSQPSSASAAFTACLSSSSLLKHSDNSNNNNNEHLVPNDKTLLPPEQLRTTWTVMDTSSSTVVSTAVSIFCLPLTSSESASKQIVMPATATSHSNTPTPAQMKSSSMFAQLDPRIRSGLRQNSIAAAQSEPSTNATSAPSLAFVVPVPPPLPSLEELTAESKDSQKDDKATIVSSTSQSSTSGTTTTEPAKHDMVITTVN